MTMTWLLLLLASREQVGTKPKAWGESHHNHNTPCPAMAMYSVTAVAVYCATAKEALGIIFVLCVVWRTIKYLLSYSTLVWMEETSHAAGILFFTY